MSNLVGYLRRNYQVLGLFGDMLLLGFQVVPRYVYKPEHRKEALWLRFLLDLDFVWEENGPA